MKKKMRYIFLLFALFVSGAGGIWFAETEARAYEYTLKDYLVDIQVMEDNVLYITEKVHADFYVPKHGIYRKIPLKNHVVREDGSESTVYARVRDVKTNMASSISYEDGYCVIRLGDKDRTVSEDDYVISYTYERGNDPLRGADEFYFNIIGTEWTDTCITGVAFSVRMPKEFDEDKLGFSRGTAGSTDYDGIRYRIDDTTISGKLESRERLGPREALTVRLELPEGYFKENKKKNMAPIVSIVCSVLAVGIAALLWFAVGRDDLVVDVLEFEPPDGLNSVDLAFVYRGKATREDMVSLVVYLANKGYLTIKEKEEEGLLFGKKKTFWLFKEKDYDGDNEVERVFLNGLFRNRNIVSKANLENSFYKTINLLVQMENSKENKHKIFEKNSINKSWLLYLMMIAVLFLALLPPMFYIAGGHLGEDSIFAIGFPLIGFIVMFAMLSQRPNFQVIIFIVVWGLGFAGVPIATVIWPAVTSRPDFTAAFVVALFSIAGLAFFNAIMSRRTEYGTRMLGRIRGFREFLRLAEKDRLESLVAENPNYFYDILPYTYVLGVSDLWMEKFESIVMEPPGWYTGPSDRMYFSMHEFNRFMNRTMSSASSSMTSSPSSSGGGRAGGGSGGGGGGSW